MIRVPSVLLASAFALLGAPVCTEGAPVTYYFTYEAEVLEELPSGEQERSLGTYSGWVSWDTSLAELLFEDEERTFAATCDSVIGPPPAGCVSAAPAFLTYRIDTPRGAFQPYDPDTTALSLDSMSRLNFRTDAPFEAWITSRGQHLAGSIDERLFDRSLVLTLYALREGALFDDLRNLDVGPDPSVADIEVNALAFVDARDGGGFSLSGRLITGVLRPGTPVAVPEPSAWSLMLLTMAVLVGVLRLPSPGAYRSPASSQRSPGA